jgi:hypothetical protein
MKEYRGGTQPELPGEWESRANPVPDSVGMQIDSARFSRARLQEKIQQTTEYEQVPKWCGIARLMNVYSEMSKRADI